jgi:hypothetical protein
MIFTYPNGDVVHGVGLAFECRLVGGTLKADKQEVSEVHFMPIEQLLAQPAPGMGAMAQAWQDIQHPEEWPFIR